MTPYSVQFAKARPTAPKVWSSSGKAPFQVVHFSDVHIDRSYVVRQHIMRSHDWISTHNFFGQGGSEANCTKPICCRNFTDHVGPVQIAAGPFGHRGCDTSTSLAHSMLQAVKGQNTKFSIFTGDVVEGTLAPRYFDIFFDNFSSCSMACRSTVSGPFTT